MRKSAFAILFFTLNVSLLTSCASVKTPTLPSLTESTRENTNRGGAPDWLTPSYVVRQVKGAPANEAEARAIFHQAEAKFKQASAAEGEVRLASFEEAAELYDKAAERGKGFAVQEDSLLMQAESQFFADQYTDAVQTYGELVKNYPTTQYLDRVDKRRFEIADYWLNEPASSKSPLNFTDDRRPVSNAFGQAIKLYDRIRFDDPSGQLSDDATMASAVANFKKGKYKEADEMFADLRENFPSSEHQFQAHFLGLKAKMMTYGGPAYTGTPLDEAEKIIRTLVTQFPHEARQHYDTLQEASREIRLQKAQREFSLAQYYDRRKEFGAARMYYQAVRDEFSDTNLAMEAESRLAQIEGRPDTQDTSLQWLANMFPDEPTRQSPLFERSPTGSAK